MYATNMLHPVQHATLTTAGLIRHKPVRMLVGDQQVTVMAPVKLAVNDPANGLQAPVRRDKNLVFALPGGKELEVPSWI